MNPARISSHRNPAFSSRGFTLIELLTVIAIIGILATIVIVSMGRIRESVKKTTCLSNLRQIQAANQLHAADNKGNYFQIKKNDQWWIVREDFTRYLNAEKRTSGELHSMADGLKCPSAVYLETSSSNWEKENFPGYGYNGSGVTASPGNVTALNQNAVLTPAKTMAFADALDFWFYKIPAAGYNWEVEQKTGVTISYRHRNGSAVVYFDGHAEYLRSDQIQPIAAHQRLWSTN